MGASVSVEDAAAGDTASHEMQDMLLNLPGITRAVTVHCVELRSSTLQRVRSTVNPFELLLRDCQQGTLPGMTLTDVSPTTTVEQLGVQLMSRLRCVVKHTSTTTVTTATPLFFMLTTSSNAATVEKAENCAFSPLPATVTIQQLMPIASPSTATGLRVMFIFYTLEEEVYGTFCGDLAISMLLSALCTCCLSLCMSGMYAGLRETGQPAQPQPQPQQINLYTAPYPTGPVNAVPLNQPYLSSNGQEPVVVVQSAIPLSQVPQAVNHVSGDGNQIPNNYGLPPPTSSKPHTQDTAPVYNNAPAAGKVIAT